jgi:hypothetical protein
MRKIRVSEFVTLDGVMESPEKWQLPSYRDDLAKVILALILASDDMLPWAPSEADSRPAAGLARS